MNILIKQARVIDPTSPFNGQIVDILIQKGVITDIAKKITTKTEKIIEQKGLHLSPGWFDLFADFADPGYEHRESLESGAAAAAAGGFTGVCVIPNTRPAIDQKSVVEYVRKKAADLPVSIHPIGAITKGTEGKELAEMYDMHQNGAIAFSDGINPVQSSGLLIKALQYVKPFNGVIMQVPDDKNINPQGQMHEGIVSTQLGLQGKPGIAETVMINRDMELSQYAASNLHITPVSSEAGIKAIKTAKQKNKQLTCSTTPYHLFFTDEDLTGYDSNLKVTPPIRTKKDRAALQKAIADGTIDCIASHHRPHHTDHKVVEFEYAQPGMISLQTAYAVVNTAMPDIEQEKWVELLAINPRRIVGKEIPTIKKGAAASITLFNPDMQWVFIKDNIASISKNSPFTGKTFTGKVLGIIHQNKVVTEL